MTIVCQCPEKCQIHPNGVEVQAKPVADARPSLVPKTVTESAVTAIEKLALTTEEKLQAKSLQCDMLNAQQVARNASDQVQFQIQTLNQFAASLLEMRGLKKDEYTLDLQQLKLVEFPKKGE